MKEEKTIFKPLAGIDSRQGLKNCFLFFHSITMETMMQKNKMIFWNLFKTTTSKMNASGSGTIFKPLLLLYSVYLNLIQHDNLILAILDKMVPKLFSVYLAK